MGSNYVSQFAKWDYPISATLRVPRGVSLSPNDDPMIFFSWNSYCETEIRSVHGNPNLRQHSLSVEVALAQQGAYLKAQNLWTRSFNCQP